jgi:hypothetical protein
MKNDEMKEYVGTKRLLARKMRKEDYNAYRGWLTPANEDAEKEGYLVEYLNSKPNMDGHKGYVSWSPADVFEATYKLVEEVRE